MSDEKPTPATAPDDADRTGADLPAEAAPDEQPAAVRVPADDSADPDVSYDSFGEAFEALTDGPDGVDETAPPQYGVGPFSIREVALGGIWLVAFVVSFFPIYGRIGVGVSLWSGIDWLLTIGVPTVSVFLIGLRRLSPQGIRRVGSLGVDQFASVAFSVSAVLWLGILWNSFVTFGASQVFIATWVVWLEFILMLAGVLLTVFAPLLPTVGDDFRHRTEVPAHRFARPARPIAARPAAPRPAAAAEATAVPSPYAPAPDASSDAAEGQPYASADASPHAPADTSAYPPADASAYAPAEIQEQVVVDETTVATPVASQAFWALAPVERDVLDEHGVPLFTIGPSAWALVIEDRGESFVVRHEDGRIGYLTDVSGVTRG